MRRRAAHIVPPKPCLDSLDGGEFLAADEDDLAYRNLDNFAACCATKGPASPFALTAFHLYCLAINSSSLYPKIKRSFISKLSNSPRVSTYVLFPVIAQ